MLKPKKKVDKKPEGLNEEAIRKMIEEINKSQIEWKEFTQPNKKKNPPIVIPTIWTTPPRPRNPQPIPMPLPKIDDDEWEKQIEDQQTVAFMQECRERTVAMKDDEKCARCKLRFRCYTEIKVEKKRKTRTTEPKPRKGGIKLGPQPIVTYKGILRGQTIGQVVLDEFSGVNDTDWFKVIDNVKKITRPNT